MFCYFYSPKSLLVTTTVAMSAPRGPDDGLPPPQYPSVPPPKFSSGSIDAANGILALSWGLEAVRRVSRRGRRWTPRPSSHHALRRFCTSRLIHSSHRPVTKHKRGTPPNQPARGHGDACDGRSSRVHTISSSTPSDPFTHIYPKPPNIQFPHKVKVRKTLTLWPLTFTGGVQYDVPLNELSATAECRDAFLGGEFSVDVLHKAVEYRKSFDLGGVSQISLRGRCDVGDVGSFGMPSFGRRRRSSQRLTNGDSTRPWNCSFGFVVEPTSFTGSGGSKRGMGKGFKASCLGTTDGYDVVTEVPLSALISAELCGHLSLPLPRAEFTAHSAGGGRGSLGRGRVEAHVAQINVVVNL